MQTAQFALCLSYSLAPTVIIQLTHKQINSSAKFEYQNWISNPLHLPSAHPAPYRGLCSPCCDNSCVINYSLHTFGRNSIDLCMRQLTALPLSLSRSRSPTLSLSLCLFPLSHMIWSVDSFLLCLVPSVASLPFSKQVAHRFIPCV